MRSSMASGLPASAGLLDGDAAFGVDQGVIDAGFRR